MRLSEPLVVHLAPQGLMEMLAAEICAFGLGLAFLLGKRKKYGYM